MKEKMRLIRKRENGVCSWCCICGERSGDDGSWPCNEMGKFGQLTPCFKHQLEACCRCGRIFNCHTGEVLGNKKDKKPVSIAPDFTDYEYLEGGGRKLPTYKGYVLDMRLWEFRKIEQGQPWEFISFDLPEGEELLDELFDRLPEGHILFSEFFVGKIERT